VDSHGQTKEHIVNHAFDPTLLPIALLIWPVTRSAVFMAAATVNLWSRKPNRRAEARRIMRLLLPATPERDQR
jgi:hypothetical protein